jgi:diguanylate cyclase (GGDEF)-like protein
MVNETARAGSELAPVALEMALEQSHDVKAKVESAAEDLASANDDVRQEIAEGGTTVPADKALEDGQLVEAKVQECADDLAEVTDTLAQGIAEIKVIEGALAQSRAALVETQSALATARADEQRATHRAMHDTATGLPNRALFNDRLLHAIALADRHYWTLAVMFIDLDQFKSVNDGHGHAAGDLVLKEVASRLLQHARDEDTICRSGGDEFLYLMMNPRSSDDVERKAGEVLRDISQPISVGKPELVVRPSIGIALYPRDGTTIEELVGNADAAMYRAKKRECGFELFGQKLNWDRTA